RHCRSQRTCSWSFASFRVMLSLLLCESGDAGWILGAGDGQGAAARGPVVLAALQQHGADLGQLRLSGLRAGLPRPVTRPPLTARQALLGRYLPGYHPPRTRLVDGWGFRLAAH